MSSQINLFKLTTMFQLVIVVIVVLSILICYSLFLFSFISVGNALQEAVVTTSRANAVLSKVTSAYSNSTPSTNVLSEKALLASYRVISAQAPKQFPQTLLSSYTVTNAQGISSESVSSENNKTSSALNYIVHHTQRSTFSVP
jgi:hypothetical protein